MANAPLALRQVRAVLQPGGIFILEYANKHNLKAVLRYALKHQTWSPFTLEPVEFEELNFDFHPRAVRNWLIECDLILQRQLTVSHFRLSALKKLFPHAFLAAMDGLASLSGDWWQLSPSVFTRSKAGANGQSAAAGTFFKCPTCENNGLLEHSDHLDCPGCGSKWAFRDGIFDFKETL